MTVLLADEVHDQVNGYVSCNHPYIHVSGSDMADTTLFTATYVGMVV